MADINKTLTSNNPLISNTLGCEFKEFLATLNINLPVNALCEVGLKFHIGEVKTNWYTYLLRRTDVNNEVVTEFSKLLTKDSNEQNKIQYFYANNDKHVGIYFGYEDDIPKEIYFDSGQEITSYEKQKDTFALAEHHYETSMKQFFKNVSKSKLKELAPIIRAPYSVIIKNNNTNLLKLQFLRNNVKYIKDDIYKVISDIKDKLMIKNETLTLVYEYLEYIKDYTFERIAFSNIDDTKLSFYFFSK
jgi:hypothetical protein